MYVVFKNICAVKQSYCSSKNSRSFLHVFTSPQLGAKYCYQNIAISVAVCLSFRLHISVITSPIQETMQPVNYGTKRKGKQTTKA